MVSWTDGSSLTVTGRYDAAISRRAIDKRVMVHNTNFVKSLLIWRVTPFKTFPLRHRSVFVSETIIEIIPESISRIVRREPVLICGK